MKDRLIIVLLCLFIIIDLLCCVIPLNLSPIVVKRDIFSFQLNEDIPANTDYYISVNESLLDDIELDLSEVKNEIGEYNGRVIYKGKEYNFTICIEDTQKPKVVYKDLSCKVQVGAEVYVYDFIESIEDDSDTYVFFVNDNEKYESVLCDEIGSFVHYIMVEDSYGNQSSKMRVKIDVVRNTVVPHIYGIDDLIISQYDELDLLDGVWVLDDLDGNLTHLLNVEGDVDNGIKGIYSVIYSVEDYDGNYIECERKIIVK